MFALVFLSSTGPGHTTL